MSQMKTVVFSLHWLFIHQVKDLSFTMSIKIKILLVNSHLLQKMEESGVQLGMLPVK